MEHEPVLAGTVTELLAGVAGPGAVFVDATLGLGGHARRLLEATTDTGARLVGIDRDPVALEEARSRLSDHKNRALLVRDDFKNLAAALERLGVEAVRGVLFDLGVSSPQLDLPARGFGYRVDGPLDMRMDPSQAKDASEVVNQYPRRDLARVIKTYGEERFAGRIADAIVRARPLQSTGELAEVVRDAIPAPARRSGPHPARRTFQALRIEVNDELAALRSALPQALNFLEPGGRLVVLSYHSLEDRMTKRLLVEESRGCVCPPGFPVCSCGARARVRVLTRKPLRPSEQEVARNPRARSARLRAAERLHSEAK